MNKHETELHVQKHQAEMVSQLFLAIVGSIVLLVYGGWSLTKLWFWFVAPLGLPPISIPWAIGLMCAAALFKEVQATPKEPPSPQEFFNHVVTKIGVITLAVFFGFVASLFMG